MNSLFQLKRELRYAEDLISDIFPYISSLRLEVLAEILSSKKTKKKVRALSYSETFLKRIDHPEEIFLFLEELNEADRVSTAYELLISLQNAAHALKTAVSCIDPSEKNEPIVVLADKVFLESMHRIPDMWPFPGKDPFDD